MSLSKAAALRQVHRLAAERYAALDGYSAVLTRREVVAGKAKPEEVMQIRFRKQPWSVHFKWVVREGQPREVVFVKGQYDNKLQTRLGSVDSALLAGRHMAFDPNSPQVREASRHAITEAGIGNVLDGLEGVARRRYTTETEHFHRR